MSVSTAPTPVNTPTGDILALYSGGNWKPYMIDAFRTRLRHARVDGYMLHAGPRGLLGTDPDHADPHDPTALVAWLRQDQPNAQIWFGVGLDGWVSYLGANLVPKTSPSDLPRATPTAEAAVTKLFEQLSVLALQLGVVGVMGDDEAASKLNPSAGQVMARLFVATFARCAPSLLRCHTTFDVPIAVEAPPGSHHYFGGQSPYPLGAWLSDPVKSDPVKILCEARQNYVATKTGLAAKGALQWRCARSDESYAAAVLHGVVSPQVALVRYLQSHNVPRYDTINVALGELLVFHWAAGTPGTDETWDAEGENAIAQLTKLRRLGYRGPGAVDRFLDATHTRVGPNDHTFGPKAEAALAALVG